MQINDEAINKVTLNNVCRLCAGVHCKTEVEAYKLLSHLKAFEIMKKNLGASFDCLKYYETVQEWNEEYGDDYPLTNEEFDLLQEVLNNE